VRPLTAIDRLSRDFYRRNSYPSRLTLRKIAPSLIQPRGPLIDSAVHPHWNGNGTDVLSFAN
jgi:hypothetical protein